MRGRLELLGGFRLTVAGEPRDLPARKAQLLVARTALARGGAVARATLAALLWEDSGEEQARVSLRQALTKARQALGSAAAALETTGDTIKLDRTAIAVDVVELEQLGAHADSRADAVSLLRGELLEGLSVREPAVEAWLLAERQRVQQLEVDVLDAATEAALANKDLSRATELALRTVAIDPLREPLHRRLMRVYAARGEPARAIKQFQDCRELLSRELGVSPEPETVALFEEIRTARAGRGVPDGRPPRRAGDGSAAAPILSPPEGELRQVALLCAMGARDADPEAMVEGRDRLAGAGAEAAAVYGGQVIPSGDVDLLLVFGLENAREDDAARAVAAARSILATAPRSSIGCASGRVLNAFGPPASVTGEARRRAALLAIAGAPGSLGVDETLGRQVEPAGDQGTGGDRGPVPLPTLRRPRAPFVGRAFERRQIAAIAAAAQEGGGGVALVLGEPGMGKTRLAQECAQDFEAGGGRVAHVRFLAFGDGAMPVWERLGRALAAHGDRPADPAEGAAQAAVHAHLLGLAMPPGGDALLAAMDPDRFEKFAIGVLVDRLADGPAAGTLLVVDDTHWADSRELPFLLGLAQRLAAARTVMVVTERPGEARFAPLIRRRAVAVPLAVLELPPLADADAARLADAMGVHDEGFVRTAIDRAGGNALFLVRLLESGVDAGGEPPASVVSLVQEQTDRLPDAHRLTLRQAAIFAQVFAPEDFAKVFGPADFSALIAAGFLSPEGNRIAFIHALVHEAVYASMTRAERRRLHAKAAACFGPSNPVRWADHAVLAATPDAATACAAAADHVLPRHQLAAGEHYIQAGLAVASSDHDARATLMISRGSLNRERGAYEAALADYATATAVAQAPSVLIQGWVRQAGVHRLQRRYGAAADCLAAADRLPTDSIADDLLAELETEKGNQAFARGDVEACRRHHGRGAQLAVGPLYRARALGGLGDAHYAGGRMRSAFESFSAAVAVAREHGLGLVELSHGFMEAYSAFFVEPGPAAMAKAHDAVDRAVQAGNMRTMLLARQVRAEMTATALQLDVSADDCAALEVVTRRIGSTRFDAEVAFARSLMLDRRGDRAGALATARVAVAAVKDSDLGYFGAVTLGLLADLTDDATERADAIARGEAALAAGSIGHGHLWFRRFAADALLGSGDWAGALAQADRLDAYTAAEPLGWSDLVTRRVRLMAKAGAGEAGDADRHAARALVAALEAALLRDAVPALRQAYALD